LTSISSACVVPCEASSFRRPNFDLGPIGMLVADIGVGRSYLRL